MTTTPTEIPPRLHEILSPTMGAPTFVDVCPRSDSEFDDCPEDVRKQVVESGGEAVCGWAVWERAGAYLFTQFHTVWKSPAGELLDVSAKASGEMRVLFIPDSGIRYTGVRLHGRYLPLAADPVVLEYITAEEHYHRTFDQVYGADFLGVPPLDLRMADATTRRLLATAALDPHGEAACLLRGFL